MNLVFMGSGRFAIPTLDALVESEDKVLAVVTQPDRPRGRGRRPSATPVKEHAQTRELYLYQPENINAFDFMRELRALAPDLIVVAAYGQFLSKDILTLPKFDCINVHASLLPRWRGPAPIARAIQNGDKKTGVTVHHVVVKTDAGEIFGQREEVIRPDDTTPDLEERLAPVGAELTLEVIRQIAADEVRPRRQNERQASYARKFRKEEGHIRWKRQGRQIANTIRAMQPYPGAYTRHENTRLVLFKARALPGGGGGAAAGTVTAVESDAFRVRCGDGEVAVISLQPESRRKMTAQEFLSGHGLKVGDKLR